MQRVDDVLAVSIDDVGRGQDGDPVVRGSLSSLDPVHLRKERAGWSGQRLLGYVAREPREQLTLKQPGRQVTPPKTDSNAFV